MNSQEGSVTEFHSFAESILKSKVSPDKLSIMKAILDPRNKPHILQRCMEENSIMAYILEWLKQTHQSPDDQLSILILRVLKLMPLTVDHLKQFKFGKIIKKMATGSRDRESTILASELVSQWTNLLNASPREGNFELEIQKRGRTDSESFSQSKQVKVQSDSPIISDVSVTSILKKKDSVKRNKKVTFATGQKLTQVKLFEVDEDEIGHKRSSGVSLKDFEKREASCAFMIAKTKWRNLKEGYELIEAAGVETDEVKISAERERSALAAVYFDATHVPYSPLELNHDDPFYKSHYRSRNGVDFSSFPREIPVVEKSKLDDVHYPAVKSADISSLLASLNPDLIKSLIH